MSRNLVQEHISEYFPKANSNVDLYSNTIIEYIENSLEEDKLILHHIHMDDFLSIEQQVKILDELIDFFHLYFSFYTEDEKKYDKKSITDSINNTINNTNLTQNPSLNEVQSFYKTRHFLRIKRNLIPEYFVKEKPVLPKIIFNLNSNTLNDYHNRAERELRELFKSNGWKRLQIPQKEISEKKSLLRRFKYTLIQEVEDINNTNVSYVALNINSFRENDKVKCSVGSKSYLDNISTILFFNNYSRKRFNDFHLNSLESLNKNHGTLFNHVFSITYNSRRAKNTIWNLILKRDNMKNSITGDLKQSFQSHVVLSGKYLDSSWCDVIFIESEANESWNSFSEIADTYGLDELISIKFKNIISICFSNLIKEYIVDSVFNSMENSLITIETKHLIDDLESDVKEKLKTELELLLGWIKDSDYLISIKNQVNKLRVTPEIIISNSIANNDKLRIEVAKLINIPDNKIKTWDSENIGKSKVIVLAYRDIGNYKYHFYPNLFEFDEMDIKRAIFLRFLFYNRYNWACYSYNKELSNLLENPVLIKHYKWNDLISRIKNTKPYFNKPDFEKEAIYTNSENATEYRVKYSNRNIDIRLNNHERIIICDEDDYEVLPVPVFFNNYKRLTNFHIVEMDELINNLKLPEIDYNRPEITDQLALLKIDFDINNLDTIENGGRLWKMLLDRKRKYFNNDTAFYSEVKNILQAKSVNIVSQSTFFNVWCNPESQTIRTSLKALKEICNYLELPNSYFQLVRRYSSDTASLTSQSTRIHNELLINLIDLDALRLNDDESDNFLLAQLTNSLPRDLVHDLKLIGISETDLNVKIKTIIHDTIKIINKSKQKVEKLIIK